MMMKLGTILGQVDHGTLLLPEFQRGYVWNRDQVRGLMRSLYLRYPVGGLLVWEPDTSSASVRGSVSGSGGTKQLLLDEQQRVTTMYGVTRGKPPEFFDGDSSAFLNLYFNVDREAFEFSAPSKMKDDPLWIDVTGLFVHGPAVQYAKLTSQLSFATYVDRIARLNGVLDREFHIEKIIGEDMSTETVVEIFNKVNSGGTKLSKGDLALAKICAHWSEARAEMRTHIDAWGKAGFGFTLDWLLRNVNAVATGRAPFSALDDVEAAAFATALNASVKYVNHLLDWVGARLGLDHDRVLMGRYAVPVVARLLHLQGGQFIDAAQVDRVLYWYVQAALWGRFAGSTETVLTQDFETAERAGIDGLIRALERWRGGNLAIDAEDFEGFGRGSRFYPLLYLLTRVGGARDLGTGIPLKAQMLGHLASLQVHHIFPKALLYESGYSRGEVNAVANFCFLTQQTNLVVGKRAPQEYLAECESKYPGVLASQWIPTEPTLWRLDRYHDFLAARRELLASAANAFLGELRGGAAATTAPRLERLTVTVEAEGDRDARDAEVAGVVDELVSLGFARPELECEIADPETGRVLAAAEAFWPDGLQVGLGVPAVLELDPDRADLDRLTELGYEVFTSVHALRGYAVRRNEVAAGARAEG